MTIIKSAGVNEYGMKVDSQGRGVVIASTEAEDRHININSGKVWSADVDEIPINASTKATPLYLAYFQNTSQVNYHMTDMRAHCGDLASVIDIDEVTVGTIGNHTAFQPDAIASRNIGKSANPIGDMAYASTATGLTGLTKVANIFHAGDLDNKSSHLATTSNIVIPPGAALGVAVRGLNATNGMTITWSLVEVSTEVT
jgi:hypothetical protein